MLNKSLEFLDKIDKEVFNDLVKEIQGKVMISEYLLKRFEECVKKVYGNQNVNQVQNCLNKFRSEDKAKEKNKGEEGQEANKEN